MSEQSRLQSSSRRELSPLRQERRLARARTLADSEPFEALDEVHALLDAGVTSAPVYALQSELLTALGCGTFAAVAAENGLAAGGDRLTFLRLLLKAHLTAFNRKPASRVLDSLIAMTGPDGAPLDRPVREEAAFAAHELHRYDLAEALYSELLRENPDDPKASINLAYARHKTGRLDQARDLYTHAVTVRPEATNGLRLLVDSRRQTPDHNDKALVLDTLGRLSPGSEDFATASFALGKVEEDLQQYDAAFAAFSAGAAIMRGRMPYTTEASRSTFETTKRWFDRPQRTVLASPMGPNPIFVLGMPRTGSTLIDRILSSHTQVRSMGELGCFKEAMKVVTGYGGGDGFHEHFYSCRDRKIDLDALGRIYINAASPADFQAWYFIDKYPMNFMDLGLIAQALPNARFIHTLRHPLDTVFGNFKQLFTLGFYHYSYDLREAAEYYLLYRDLMAFWRDRFPGRILDIVYEDHIADPYGTAHTLLDHLGLDWDDRVLRFHENAAPVDTASLSQVRRPIYKTAVGHWQRYEKHLGPAIDALAGQVPL
ncbi:tetratricopeptide repeat-containing sulfotransferase family protein [Asticcacaulis sp. 201]|uniref:tetratricopeptide repeat-containing sulfotransferase family protein n=1 Tax=Asticcacaulis sp. 201 TaxID=3028787 RepID=UPI00291626BB|nr:sulfotransferase [Asticcacaulis sp. 201]MDV6331137.1 sulfotransferase [Asticcacaulis sp. 201]